MAQLEIRAGEGGRTVVELGRTPLPIGFDAEGDVAWGASRVARTVAVVAGDRLRVDGREQGLLPGESVEVAGITITYRTGADVRAAALNEIGQLLWTVETSRTLFDRVLDALERVLEVKRSVIALFDDDATLTPAASRGDGLEPNPTLTRAVIESGAAILTSEAAVSDDDDEISIDVRSILCAPLRHEGEPQGVLYVDNLGRSESFSNDELDFAAALAHLTSFALANLTQTERLREENTLLKAQLGVGERLVSASAEMEEIYRKLEKVAGFDATVLITGESGVGKEMVAREIHRRSPRSGGPFVAINCAAIPDTLLESELFGYAPRSGISGADPKGRAGRFEQASEGTIFLDEIGEMKLDLQAKLLRVIQDKMVDRLNDTVSRPVDVRILVATNQELERTVREGRFREDLYYRLNVVALEVPPLRRRTEDIAVLAEYFIRTYAGPAHLQRVKLSPAALRALEAAAWPGNVRELKNCIEQALILGDGKTIRLADLPPRLRKRRRPSLGDDLPPLSDVEKEHIALVLRATGWNKARSARILGISKPTLYDKIRNYSLEKES